MFLGSVIFTQAVAYTTYFELGEPVLDQVARFRSMPDAIAIRQRYRTYLKWTTSDEQNMKLRDLIYLSCYIKLFEVGHPLILKKKY